MFCLIGARYNMTAEVYDQTQVQGPSGQIKRVWDYENPIATIRCIARGIAGGGIRVVGSTERWGDLYDDVEYVMMQTDFNLSKRHRIGMIRASDGQIAWEDGDEAMIFDVLGAKPVIDPFGRLVEYDILLTKVEVE